MSAKRPAVIFGKGIRWSEPYDEISRLVSEYGIPFITSPMGRDYLPDDHPLCYNHARRILLGNADVVRWQGQDSIGRFDSAVNLPLTLN